MATAKKAAPAKTSKKAAKAAEDEDDLLAPKRGKKAAPAKKAAPPARKGKKAAADEDDDLLAPKKVTKKAAPAKRAKKQAEFEGTADEVRAVLLKTRKNTSYTDIADANNFNIRMVRRQARNLRDSGQLEISKEGTVGFVKALKKAA